MREILFRGKRTDNGEWIEGDLAHSHGRTYCGFYFETISQVDPPTVGQYTGLTDANGVRIFDGDIVRCCIEEGLYVTAQVVFECGAFGLAKRPELPLWYPNACNNDNFMSLWEIIWNAEELDGECAYMLEVIGNIHDNPELLEV